MASVSEAVPQQQLLRYNNGAVFLHWLTALFLITQLAVGFVFATMAKGPSRGEVFTVHKTLGVTILILAVIRLGWRIAYPPPPYPLDMPRWERVLGVWNHRLFYFLLIVLPLTGLMMVSAGAGAEGETTTTLLGGIPFPLIPGVPDGAHEPAETAHGLLVYLTIALLVLHVCAALKHQFERNRAAGRMPPFQAIGEEPTPAP